MLLNFTFHCIMLTNKADEPDTLEMLSLPFDLFESISCLFSCFERWSDLMNAFPQCLQANFFTPACARLWRDSSSLLAKVLSHFGYGQLNGFSPVWILICALRCESLKYDL